MNRKTITESVLLIAPAIALLFFCLTLKKPGHVRANEGFYVSSRQQDGSLMYIRLYKDGIVIAVTSSGNPKQVDKWFNRSHPLVSKGQYYVEGTSIQFSATSGYGTVDYKGTVDNGYLRLNISSRINKHKSFQEYKLVTE